MSREHDSLRETIVSEACQAVLEHCRDGDLSAEVARETWSGSARQKWVKLAMAGEEAVRGESRRRALRLLDERLADFVRGHALAGAGTCKCSDTRDDIVQEVLLRYYQRCRRTGMVLPYNDLQHLGNWAKQVAGHRIVDRGRLRASKTAPLQEIDPISDEPTPLELIEGEERRAELWRVVDRLAPPAPEVIRLRYIEDLTFKEIADFLGWPLATVYGRLQGWLSQLSWIESQD